LHWYWPVVTNYSLIVTVRQTQLIQSKVMMTRDLKTIVIAALVTYHVKDVVAAVAKIADLASDVMERAQGAIFIETSAWKLEDIQARRVEFNERLTRRVAESLSDYGVEILHVQVTEFAPCRVLALRAGGAMGQYTLWTGF
jgi:regulator of protease activity HflC (stomatin/prohibitin superfamily)